MDIEFDFVMRPPTRVGALAAALNLRVSDLHGDGLPSMGTLAPALRPHGLSQDIASLSASHGWDIHHEPVLTSAKALQARQLTSYVVRFRRGRTVCEATLRATHGAPISARNPAADPGAYRRYGPFFVDAGEREDFVLEWYEREPDWAKSQVDGRARERAVGELAARIRCADDEDALAAAITALPLAAGIRSIPRSRSDAERRLEFDRPMPAIDFARALEQPHAVAQSVGVHMSMWKVVTLCDAHTAMLTLGPWEIEASLDGASGAVMPDVFAPAALVRALGATDVVRSLRITRRDRAG